MKSILLKYAQLITVSALALSSIALTVSCNRQADNSSYIDQRINVAGQLKDNKLYQAAIDEYQKILNLTTVDSTRRANINYLVGDIYFNNLKDYQQAAAYYIRARTLDPNGSFSQELAKNLVSSLENMGNILDARRELASATDINAKPHPQGDPVVAKIGDTKIYLSDVEAQIENLPPDVQKQFTTHAKKVEFMRQYVGSELMYRAAQRLNYDNDPDVKKQEADFQRKLLINKYIVDKVMPNVKIDTMDVRNYYQANKDKLFKGAPYDSVKAQVFMNYQQEKAQSAFSDYASKLAQTEHVEFYDDNVK
jgi:tetratricopeptide (TPR) repeat protein